MTATVSQPTQTAMDVPAKDENGTAPALASQDVGLIFVREYYTFLNRKPQRLYAFYGENSVLVRGDEGESVSTYHGQEEIRKKFQDLQFNDCKVLVTQVDSQHSADNGIIIQVLGEMSNMDNPSQKFAQTFFLAPQHNGYYVLNDIFRFLKDEVNIDYYACEEEELEEQQALEAPKTVQEDKVPEPADMQPASVQPDSVVSPVSSEKSKTASPKVKDQAIGSPAKEDKRKDEKQKETKAGASEKIVEKKGEAGARAAETKPVETKKEKTALANAVDVPTEKKTEEPAVDSKEKEMPATPTKTAPEKRPGSPKQVQSSKQAEKPAAAAAKSTAPKTWANLAANDSDKWGTHVADAKGPVASVPSSQQPKQSQQTQHLQQGTSQAQPQHQNQQQQHQQQHQQQQQQQQQHGGHGHGHGHKEQYQIFVKNVVSHIQEDSLRDAFSQFGTVKNVNVMHNRNAAFVDFATTEAVQKALSQHKVNIGNHVVLAEERRHGGNRHQYNKQQQQSGQQRSFDRRYQQDGGHRRGNAGGAGRGNKQQQQRGNSGQK